MIETSLVMDIERINALDEETLAALKRVHSDGLLSRVLGAPLYDLEAVLEWLDAAKASIKNAKKALRALEGE